MCVVQFLSNIFYQYIVMEEKRKGLDSDRWTLPVVYVVSAIPVKSCVSGNKREHLWGDIYSSENVCACNIIPVTNLISVQWKLEI